MRVLGRVAILLVSFLGGMSLEAWLAQGDMAAARIVASAASVDAEMASLWRARYEEADASLQRCVELQAHRAKRGNR